MLTSMSHHVIFIPGLADNRTFGQDIAIQTWRLFGLKPHYLALRWDRQDSFEVKVDKLLKLIEELQVAGHDVSLVGASAGASAVINAYVANKNIHRVIYICGKINRPDVVSPKVYADNPDFKESLALLQQNLTRLTEEDKQKLLSLFPYKDTVVPYADTRITGVAEQRIVGWSHSQGIFSGIVISAPKIARFIRHDTLRQN
jgi:hypothetical protein